METASQALFTAGTFILVFAFAATIAHAVFLANGRRLAVALAAGATGVVRPAWAGVATGSFVETRSAAAAAGPADFAAPSPLSGAARWLTIGAFLALVSSMTIRGIIVGRGPWGNLFEFSVAFARPQPS